jgi:hypothetical protein
LITTLSLSPDSTAKKLLIPPALITFLFCFRPLFTPSKSKTILAGLSVWNTFGLATLPVISKDNCKLSPDKALKSTALSTTPSAETKETCPNKVLSNNTRNNDHCFKKLIQNHLA